MPQCVKKPARLVCTALLSVLLGACAERPSAPPQRADSDGAPRAHGRFTNVAPTPESAGWLKTSGLWARKVWTTLWPRPGAAAWIEVDPQAMRQMPGVTWIGHATLLIHMDGVSFITDPMFSKWAAPLPYTGPRRAVPPGVSIDQLPALDFALISHDHYDHADLASVKTLAARGVRFIVPLGMGEWIKAAGGQATELDWWQHVDVAGVRVHCVPAQHGSGRSLGDAGRRLWSGWYVSGATRRFYHAGDTGYTPMLIEIARRLGPPHLAAIPIGAYDTPAPGPHFHANPEEAVRLGLELEARHILGMHFGTFDLSDEVMSDPPLRFQAESRRRGLPPERTWLLRVGESRRW
jgi:N-acyl-phosphatidylethanolamine-hydrolysing phospholipase D